ncbi:MAG: M23 family metallopeptidase [Polyangiaceae bacterium]|nr:M23 family metallopeptidase [Polyangiaceae bacterium]
MTTRRQRSTFVPLLVLLVSACSSGAESAPSDAPSSKSTEEAAAATAAAASAEPSAEVAATANSAAAPETAALASDSAVVPASAPPGTSASAVATEEKADPSRLQLTGKVIQGGLLFAKVDGKVGRIDFPGHRAVVSDDGEFPIAFFRNAPKKEKMVIHFKDGSALEHVFDVEQRTYEKDEISGLPNQMVKPDAKMKRKIAEGEARVDAVRMKYGLKNCYKDGFSWPVVGKITSRYGQDRVLNDTDGGIHWGVDIAVPLGTPVKAPACGKVVFVESDMPLAGGTLVIDHGHGVTSTFIHLSGFKKKVGDEVSKGDIVATSGKSGRATGSHLHWAMNYFEIRVDPELLVPPMPGQSTALPGASKQPVAKQSPGKPAVPAKAPAKQPTPKK